MANQKSLSELIDQAESIHKDQFENPLYSYKKIKYPYQYNGNWEIDCIRHGITFFQNFRKHLSGQTGCKECISEKKAKNNLQERTQNFIQRSQAIHKKEDGRPRYNYAKVVYINNHEDVIINCHIHGDFLMTPANHTHKTKPQKCPKCSGRHVRSKEEFIVEAQQKHMGSDGQPLYDYSNIEYVDTTTHILMFCPRHNKTFRQTPAKHLSGQKCPECSKEIVAKKNTLTKEEWIAAAQKIHCDLKGNSKYDYSQVNYINNHTNVTIICPHHGPFNQIPSVHKDSGSGCPSCRSSKGEQIIAEFLVEKQIKFEKEFKYSDCVYIKPLPFDFKVECQGKIILIEYHGEIHFKPVKYSKNDIDAESRFLDIQTRDSIKKEYAISRGITFVEFTYREKYHEILEKLAVLFDIK
jgi:hypothetical protein